MKILIQSLLLLFMPLKGMAATHDYVDLGLPSATMWATCNVGANTPEEYGSFFAWGETSPKSTYSWKNYKYGKNGIGEYEDYVDDFHGNRMYDAATANWGNEWFTPSYYDIKELCKYCTFTKVKQKDVWGLKVTGRNGNSIFLPFAGYKYDSKYVGKGSESYYWTSTSLNSVWEIDGPDPDDEDPSKSHALYIYGGGVDPYRMCQLRTGMPIRPVLHVGTSMVDLGLSTKWASSNLGATSEEQRGYLYAWGEVSPKSSYTWKNYKYAQGTASSVMDIGYDICGTEYDAAASMHNEFAPQCDGCGGWELPTEEDFNELIRKCTFKEATVKGVKGYRVTGPNGNSIFLPFAGCSYDGKNVGNQTNGYYWSGYIDTTNKQKAKSLYVKAGEHKVVSAQRRTGIMIRPVYKNNSIPEPQPIPELTLVDLGLSVKWADVNLNYDGYDYHSSYYAWGELDSGKDSYTWKNYEYADGTSSTCWDLECDNISQEPNYDAATITVGYYDEEVDIPYDLCMPTEEQWNELFQMCTFKVETDEWQGRGYRVTGPNGNSIFLPFSGCSYDGKDYGVNDYAYYWTGNADPGTVSKARAAFIKSGDRKITSIQRRTGAAIRPVSIEWAIPPEPYFPTTVAFEPVDLGLSVYWCSENVGEQPPGGDYIYTTWFAWGETSTKDYGDETDYTWASYEHANGTSSSVIDIGSDISETDYDAACAMKDWMRDSYETFYEWRMPTSSEIQELITKCTWKETGEGYKVTGPNGNSIFLPFSGCSYDGKRFDDVPYAYFWSSNVDKSNKSKAKALYIKTGTKPTLVSIQRRTGCAIRPVVDNTEWVELGLSRGNLWSRYNLNASTPEKSGGYWAWCEEKEKSDYTWKNYKSSVDPYNWFGGITFKYNRFYDVYIRVPDADDFEELINDCELEERTFNGVKGIQFIGPNGNSIFIPYAGSKYDSKGPQNGTLSYYWTQDAVMNDSKKAYALSINNGIAELTKCQRRTGLPLRLVAYYGPGMAYLPGDGADGISDMKSFVNSEDDTIYTLQGVKVEGDLKPGVYIRNGKKFIVK